jgi:putative ABC transport system permease protein
MRKVTLRSLWEHKRRLLSTVLAVVLGVSFMSGTFIMSTTLDQSFDDLFSKVVSKVDGLVQGRVLFSDLLSGDQRANLPESLTADVKDVRGVDAAYPFVSTNGALSFNRVLGADGKALGGGQGSTQLESWIDDQSISPFNLTHGHGPEHDDEVVLNVAAAEEGDLHVGDDVTVVGKDGPETFTIVGTFGLGAAKSAGGAVTVGFTLPKAQELAGLTDEINAVWVKADDGVSQEQLVQRIRPLLVGGAEVVTGKEAIAQLSTDSQTNFQFLTLALTIFGLIALLVGIFVISNTFSILVAQRTKELALLRALGASRAQVLASVLLEATVVGAVAAVLGLFGGLLLSKGVTAGLGAAGAELPSTRLVVQPDTIVLSLAIGVLITVLASLFPAIRATRVPPLAALRDVAIDRSNLSKARIGFGLVAIVAGAVNLSAAWRAAGDTKVLPQVGVGGVLVIVGFLVVGPVLAGRTVRVLGAPLPRFRGITGRLATENAARSPKRTSATASAVVIGVALVVFIQVFAASASRSVRDQVEKGFSADFIVTSKSSGLQIAPGIPASVAETVRNVPGVKVVSPLGFGSIGVVYPDGKTATHYVSAFDPKALVQVAEPEMVQGDISKLSDTGVVLDKFVAKEHHIVLGDSVGLIGPGGEVVQLQVEGISHDRNVLGLVSLTRTTYATLNPSLVDVQVAGKIEPGQDLPVMLKRISRSLEDLPSVQVLDRDGFIGSIVKQITSFITLIRGLLVLSIITALVGIANTLSLSIGERIRELGLLRAVGMDRADVRSAVRWEALLISALGALVGVSMGMFLSVAMVKAMAGFGLASFAFPGTGLVVIILVTTVLGTMASIRPARRAAGLSILDAIASE